MIMFDTNAAIYYLQNDGRTVRVVDELRRDRLSFVISTISELEIFSFPGLTIPQMVEISTWLETLTRLTLDSITARDGARLRREYGLKTPDAVVAATALRYRMPLLTRDKDFGKVKELTIIKC